MTEAKLLEVSDNAQKPRSHGRRGMDKVAYALLEIQRVIKLAGGVVGELSKFFLAAVGAGSLGYAAWQDFKSDMARNATPPALVKPKEAK